RCTAGADRWPHGLRHGTAAPVWAVEAPRTAPGPRPHTPAEVDALARAALCARGAVVPAPAPRGRSTRRGVRHAAGHRAGPGGELACAHGVAHRGPVLPGTAVAATARAVASWPGR